MPSLTTTATSKSEDGTDVEVGVGEDKEEEGEVRCSFLAEFTLEDAVGFTKP
jgi:hypothetical protein